jgi:hypothetical protein
MKSMFLELSEDDRYDFIAILIEANNTKSHVWYDGGDDEMVLLVDGTDEYRFAIMSYDLPKEEQMTEDDPYVLGLHRSEILELIGDRVPKDNREDFINKITSAFDWSDTYDRIEDLISIYKEDWQ